MWFARTLTGALVMCVSASISWAQQADPARTGTFVLTHADGQVLGASSGGRNSGLGLAGITQAEITEGMDNQDGATASTKQGSRVEFVVTTVLDERSAGTWIVLHVERSQPELAPDIGLAGELRLLGEADQILIDLEDWSKQLTEQDLETLKADDPIPVDLNDVFATLTYWSLVQTSPLFAVMDLQPLVRLEVETLTDAKPNPGLPFRGVLVYDLAPEVSPTSILAEWEEGRAELPVYSSEDGTRFSTHWQYPTPVDALVWDDTKRFPAQKSVVELVGTWAVEYSDPSGRSLTGTLTVDPDGSTMRLILNPGQDVVAYQAIEVLSTTNPETGNVGLEARFERPMDPAWKTPESIETPPEGSVLQMPFYASAVALSAMGLEKTIDVYLPEEQPVERIRLQLWDQAGDGRLSGPWYYEDNAGFLGDGGRQTWTRAQ
ncbi:MAG: hypothetical protein AAGK37_06005 [Pseudomonadota bacterium]